MPVYNYDTIPTFLFFPAKVNNIINFCRTRNRNNFVFVSRQLFFYETNPHLAWEAQIITFNQSLIYGIFLLDLGRLFHSFHSPMSVHLCIKNTCQNITRLLFFILNISIALIQNRLFNSIPFDLSIPDCY